MLSSVALCTSCGDDDGDTVPQNSAAVIAGTYSGTWTVVSDSPTGETTTTYDGTIVLAQTTATALNMTTSIPSITEEASKTAPVNSVSTTDGFFFSCNSDNANVNPYGKAVSGRVFGSKLYFTYTGEVKIGRRKYGASYAFEGVKQ